MSSELHEKENIQTLKYLSLVFLVIQNTLVVLIGKYSTVVSSEKYITFSAVILTEILKLITCLIGLYFKSKNLKHFLSTLNTEIFKNYRQTLKLSIPSFLYVIQNNLLLVSINKLPAAIFQVSYQLKILTTALMSIVLLNKKLGAGKWFSLILLFIGVIFVNLKPSSEFSSKNQINENDSSASEHAIGLICVVISCMTSAFSGVYFERILKKEKADLLVSNIQLALSGILFGIITGLVSNYEIISEKGFFVGFNIYIIIYILLQAFGGLLIGFVVKYADNILKGFATSIAIIVSSILSYFIFSFQFTPFFVLGGSLVVISVVLYSYL